MSQKPLWVLLQQEMTAAMTKGTRERANNFQPLSVRSPDGPSFRPVNSIKASKSTDNIYIIMVII